LVLADNPTAVSELSKSGVYLPACRVRHGFPRANLDQRKVEDRPTVVVYERAKRVESFLCR
jgi:hypothetical protein